MTDVDVLIIGGGAMGLSTAWQLARRGRRVRLLEQFQPGHHMGASHGATRNFNTSYTQPRSCCDAPRVAIALERA